MAKDFSWGETITQAPAIFTADAAREVAHLQNRVFSSFSNSICLKVSKDLWHSTPENARAILLSPVRLTRNEKEELVAVLEVKPSNPS